MKLKGTRLKNTKETTTENTYFVEVTFDSNPNTATTNFTNLKYNKEAAINIEWDDNSMGSYKSFHNFNKRAYTDGCGNKINYSAAVAVNGININNNNREWGENYPNKLSYTNMKELIKSNWDIENHSMYHLNQDALNAKKDIVDLTQLIWNNTDYLMNTIVVPTNYPYYVLAGQELGTYVAVTTQGAKDGFTIYPVNTPSVFQDINTLPSGYVQLNRCFSDEWEVDNLDSTFKIWIDRLLSESNSTVNRLLRLGTHQLDDTLVIGMNDLLNYIEAVSNDRLLVTTMREVIEYKWVKDNISKSETISGNKLKITFDLSTIPQHIRWRDISFIINTDKKILNVSVLGCDNYTYNPVTKLVNIFKQKLTYTNPST